jgi:Mg-chelatase subunit ChlD
MTTIRKWQFVLIVAVLLGFGVIAPKSVPADEVSLDDLTTLIDLGIADDEIINKILTDGISFDASDVTLEKLKGTGASVAVIDAVRRAHANKDSRGANQSAQSSAPPVTFPDVVKLLKLQISEESILERLNRSVTTFQLSSEQVEELKAAGASENLIRAMQQVRTNSTAAAEIITDLVVILDSSGSMREQSRDGEVKMDSAKKVVNDLIQNIPDRLNVAFVVYGHKVFGPANDPRNCQAVEVTRPLAPLDAAGKTDLQSRIRQFQPTGATPIAKALQVAGSELGKHDSYCGLLLITDGLETCQGDPQAEAATLAANPKLTFGVNIVGFDVSGSDGNTLKKIADAGRGKYYDAASAEELTERISTIAAEIKKASRPPEVVNTSRRAFRILQPSIELPPMKALILVETGQVNSGNYTTVSTISKFDQYLNVPSSSKNYDIVWIPEKGRHVIVMQNVMIAERRVVDVQPSEILGMVQVNGTDQVKNVFAMPSGEKPQGGFTPTSEVDGYGEVMVVPAGTYDIYIWIDNVGPSLIEEGLEVAAGKLHRL